MSTVEQPLDEQEKSNPSPIGFINTLIHTLARQAAKPRGLLGKIFGSAMKKMNKNVITWVVRRLDIHPNDKILDIGFGPGESIMQIANRLDKGFVIGVDCSDTMVQMATKKNRKAIAAGKAELYQGQAEKLLFPNIFFDKVLCIHVIYFWKNPEIELKEIFRVLVPGGRCVFFIGDKGEMEAVKMTQTGIYKLYDKNEIKTLLQNNGFSAIKFKASDIKNGPLKQGLFVTAYKPEYP
ncbi:MAG: class I SAM-dependent methyltransferase [Pseudomonadota bacterium]